MSITFVRGASGQNSAATTLTIAFDATGCDAIVVGCRDAGNATLVTGVTYNGVALVLKRSDNTAGSSFRGGAVYVGVAPTTGTNNVVISYSGAQTLSAVVGGFAGVDQTTPTVNTAGRQALAGSPFSTSITTTAGNMAVDFYVHTKGDSTSAPVVSGSQTLVGGLMEGTFVYIRMSYLLSASAMAWTWAGPSTQPQNQSIVELKAAVGGATVPDAPTIGTAIAGNANASVSFTAPASDGGATITGYTVTSTPGSLTGTGATSPITVSGLTNNTAYTFKAKATNAVGTGAESAASNSVTPSNAAIVSTVPVGRIFRHSATTWTAGATGSIVESGTYSGFTPNQIRLVQDATNTALTGFDWAAITTATGGNYAHTFASVPQGVGTGWYNVQFRDSAVPAVVVSTGKRGVGIHIANYGQSQSTNQALTGDSTLTPTGMARVHGDQYASAFSWAALDTATMNGYIAADILLNSLTGGKIPIAFLNLGYPGTSLVRGGPNGNWLPTSGSLYQYGKNIIAGLEGKVDAVVDIRGESDANNGTVTQAEFYAGLGTLYTQTRTDCGNANLPIIQVILGKTVSYWTDASGELIKKAQVQRGADANTYRVESYDQGLQGDNLHRTATGCAAVGRRWAQAVAVTLGLATQHRSPRIASVAQVSGAVFDATLTHSLGTDFTPTTGITGLRVTDSVTSAVLTVSSAVRQAANKIRITLSATPTNMPNVATAYGIASTVNIADNSALSLPLEYTSGVTATLVASAATSVTLTLTGRSGAARANLTNLKWTFFDQMPGSQLTPVAQGTTETTDATNQIVIDITGTTLLPAAVGWLTLTNSNGTVNTTDYTFAGPVTVA